MHNLRIITFVKSIITIIIMSCYLYLFTVQIKNEEKFTVFFVCVQWAVRMGNKLYWQNY